MTNAARLGLFPWLSVGCLLTGCASSQEVTNVRQDLQNALEETRTTYDRALAKVDTSRKASEESQGRFATDLKNQEQHLATLSKQMQDLHLRQEYAVRERTSTQDTNRALRAVILHALKAEQSDLQQRLKRLGDSIVEMEQGRIPPPVQSVGPGQPDAGEGSKPDPQKPEPQPANRPKEPTGTN